MFEFGLKLPIFFSQDYSDRNAKYGRNHWQLQAEDGRVGTYPSGM